VRVGDSGTPAAGRQVRRQPRGLYPGHQQTVWPAL